MRSGALDGSVQRGDALSYRRAELDFVANLQSWGLNRRCQPSAQHRLLEHVFALQDAEPRCLEDVDHLPVADDSQIVDRRVARAGVPGEAYIAGGERFGLEELEPLSAEDLHAATAGMDLRVGIDHPERRIGRSRNGRGRGRREHPGGCRRVADFARRRMHGRRGDESGGKNRQRRQEFQGIPRSIPRVNL